MTLLLARPRKAAACVRARSPFRLLSPLKIEEDGWPLEKTAFRLLQLALVFCPFWWAIDSREIVELKEIKDRKTIFSWMLDPLVALKIEKHNDVRRARWVVCSSCLLILLWLVNPPWGALEVAFAFFAAWRLFEIVTTGAGTCLAQAQQVRARNLVTIAAYAGQCTFIFAILYHSLADGNFVLQHGGSASDAFDYLYASWSNFTSLGSEYEPHGSVARFLAVSTTTMGIVLLGVLLAFGIDAVEKNEGKRELA